MKKLLPLLLVLATAAPASAAEVLPDLEQQVPFDVSARLQAGEYQLGFASQVNNVGPGTFQLDGSSAVAGDPMVADQVVELDDGGTTTYPGVAQFLYVTASGHQHWHVIPFSRYRLVGAGVDIADVKQGFCLWAGFANDYCAQGKPNMRRLTMGIDPGLADDYDAFIEGQYIPITRAGVPDGEYDLIHDTNRPTDNLQEVTRANNTASVRLSIEWPPEPSSAPPLVRVLSCDGPGRCDAVAPPPPGPPPPGPPPPGPPPPASTPPPPPPPAALRMSRASAIELARRAVRQRVRRAGRVRAACTRRHSTGFSCRVAFRGGRGRVGVWYSHRSGRLVWLFNLDAGDVHARRVAGGERPASAAFAGTGLVCRIAS